MQTPMNYLLVNLAVADMMFTTFITPRFVFSHIFKHPEGTAGHYLCVFVTGGNLTWTGGDASVFSLVAIAFERYFAIMHPYSQWGRVTSKKLKSLIVASWVFAVFMTFPLYLSITYSKERDFCVEDWADIAYAKAYSLCCFLFLGAVPLCIMGVLYLRVVLSLWCSRQRENDRPRQALMRSRKRVTRMVILVSVLYGITWMPNLTSYVLTYHHPSYVYADGFYLTSILLVTVNSTVNPFIYAFTNVRFRRSLCYLLCHCCSSAAIQPIYSRPEDGGREPRPLALTSPWQGNTEPLSTGLGNSQGQGNTELSSQGQDNTELSSQGQDNTKLSSQGQGNTELSSQGQGNTELSSQGRGNTELSSHGQDNTELLSQEHGNTELSSQGQGNTELSSQGQGNTDLSSQGQGNTELSSPGQSNIELSSQGQGNTELSSQGLGKTEPLSPGLGNTKPLSTEPLSPGQRKTELSSQGQGNTKPSSQGQGNTEPSSQGQGNTDLSSQGQNNKEQASRG